MLRTIICSPYQGDIGRNRYYALECLRHSFEMGEAPFASHILYPTVLKDDDPKERDRALQAESEWIAVADIIVFYVDNGWSPGMIRELKIARMLKKRISVRQLYSRTWVAQPLEVKEILTHLRAQGANIYYFGDEKHD